jgi:thiamine biosynthesis lipoprotein
MVVARQEVLAVAEAVLHDVLDGIDRTCSRFRADSEIQRLSSGAGSVVPVSALLLEAIAAACSVAERTGGAVDPTVGHAVEWLGYDRDFEAVPAVGSALRGSPEPAPGWWRIEFDDHPPRVRVPSGVLLDLGATAKALAADRAAAQISSVTGSGVLVSLGGDVAVSGRAPSDGWPIGISVSSSGPFDAGPVVCISEGGIASSSTVVRGWRRGGRRLHHIVDPATGDCASEHWRLVSVAAGNCVDANAASTAAIVWGDSALDRLQAMGLPARLVRHDGAVVTVGGWPPDDAVSPIGRREQETVRR